MMSWPPTPPSLRTAPPTGGRRCRRVSVRPPARPACVAACLPALLLQDTTLTHQARSLRCRPTSPPSHTATLPQAASIYWRETLTEDERRKYRERAAAEKKTAAEALAEVCVWGECCCGWLQACWEGRRVGGWPVGPCATSLPVRLALDALCLLSLPCPRSPPSLAYQAEARDPSFKAFRAKLASYKVGSGGG